MMATRNPRAGGFLIALAIIVGTVVGGLRGQPSLGLLAGAAVGLIGAALMWIVDP